MIIKNGNVLMDNKFEKIDLCLKNGKINLLNNIDTDTCQIINAEEMYVLPGMIDVHTHGGKGIDVNCVSQEELEKLAIFFASQGVTGFLPTVLTDTHERTCEILEKIECYMRNQDTGAKVLGIHLEGPYLAKEFKGAMPENLIANTSIDKFIEYEKKSKNNINTITVAVESPEIMEFIRYAVSKNIVVSLGHTGAPYDDCMRCIREGANRTTHTFNGMGPLHQHRPSILGAALESDVYCEAICDGFHLHPAIIRLLIKTKGINRVIGITDSVMAAGLPDGKYKLGVNDIIVENGDARLADGSSRAGSTLTMIKALKNILEYTQLPLEECIKLLTINPAMMLNINNKKGTLDLGKDADIVIVNKQYNIMYTIVEGKLMYQWDKELLDRLS